MRMALRIETYAPVVVELEAHRAVLSNAFYRSQLAIRNLQILVGRSELNAVAGGEHLFLLSIHRDAHLPARIVSCLLPIAPKNRKFVFLGIYRDNARVFALIYAGFARAS